MKENIEIQATYFERIRPYRMNEASENGEFSAAIESMGKHGSINSYFYVKLSAQLLAQLCPHTRFAGQKNNLYNGKG